jgi:hypothetical protein
MSDRWDALDELDEVVGTTLRNLAISRLHTISTGPARRDPQAAISGVLAETEEGLRSAGFSDAVVTAVREHLARAFDSVGTNPPAKLVTDRPMGDEVRVGMRPISRLC